MCSHVSCCLSVRLFFHFCQKWGRMLAGIKTYPYICDVNYHDMPTIFEIFGLRFFFYSDDHPPVHVHVVKGDDDAKIRIEGGVELVYNHGLKARDLKRALKLAEMYRDDIMAKWHEYH